MKKYRLTYEEIDTNNKENSIKITKEHCLSDEKYSNLLLPILTTNCIKLSLWEDIRSRIYEYNY